jgi:hypothetical protein
MVILRGHIAPFMAAVHDRLPVSGGMLAVPVTWLWSR